MYKCRQIFPHQSRAYFPPFVYSPNTLTKYSHPTTPALPSYPYITSTTSRAHTVHIYLSSAALMYTSSSLFSGDRCIHFWIYTVSLKSPIATPFSERKFRKCKCILTNGLYTGRFSGICMAIAIPTTFHSQWSWIRRDTFGDVGGLVGKIQFSPNQTGWIELSF